MANNNKMALHWWNFGDILTGGSPTYQVNELQIIDPGTTAVMSAFDVFFGSPNGSTIYPFIYGIQVSESIMWNDWSYGSAIPRILGDYHSFSVVDAFGCSHGYDGSIFTG